MDQEEALRAAWAGVSTAFAALGRVFICLDENFRVIHASEWLDRWLGEGTAASAEGRAADELLGRDILGPDSSLRHALLAHERREGLRAFLHVTTGESHLVSVTAAPFPDASDKGVCDPRVHYILVLRPAEEDAVASAGPTAFAGLVARSRAMSDIFRLVENLRESDATVLLTGESGTGKEVVARAIHERSARRSGRFVGVNCGALPADLLESELFGHVRGAFTGAVKDRVGRFELAASGTLFLDEVGDLPLPLQVKLLRVLQERTFERVGESISLESKARIIAATNVDLVEEVRAGRFREDLYYRLRVVPIEIPPLRERHEDIEPLAQALLARVASRHGRVLRLSPDALRSMLAYSWPGNVRELENALEFGVAVSGRETLLPEDLPPDVLAASPARKTRPLTSPQSSEHDELRDVLSAHQWRREDAARALGISRTTLWRRMREAGLSN